MTPVPKRFLKKLSTFDISGVFNVGIPQECE